MRRAGLTDAAVRRFTAPKGKTADHSDWPLSALICRVSGPTSRTPAGHVAWISRPRVDGRQVRLTHGSYPAVTLELARRRAKAAAEAIVEGKPIEIVRAIGEGRTLSAEGTLPRPPDTVGKVVELFTARHLQQRNRSASHVSTTKGIFKNHVLPVWRDRDIRSITRREIIERLDEIADSAGPIAANRAFSALSKLMRWAQQRDILDALPLVGIEKPGQEISKDRVLADDEIAVLWRCATTLGYPFGTFFKLLVLLGQRRSETAGICWGDLDLAAGLLTLPAEVTKNRQPHVVPLAAPVLELFKDLPRIGAFVLTTTGENPISGFSKAKGQIDRMIAALMGEDEQAPEPWTPHDLRRTAATGMARLGVDRFVVQRVLNHSDRSVTGRYDRYEYLSEKRVALTRWAEHVGGLTRPKLVSAEAG